MIICIYLYIFIFIHLCLYLFIDFLKILFDFFFTFCLFLYSWTFTRRDTLPFMINIVLLSRSASFAGKDRFIMLMITSTLAIFSKFVSI